MKTKPFLSELILEVTNACHHRCVHCSTVGGLPMENELTQAERLRVLEEARGLGLVELRLLGGDPLFRFGHTVELLAKANALGVRRALICTSAVEDDLGWLATLGAFSPMRVSAEASVYSPSPEIHDQITQKTGSLERLLANSREALRIGFDFNWNFVWMKPNFLELEPVLALASDVGIKRVRVLRLMLNGRARENRDALVLPTEWEKQCGAILQVMGERFPGVAPDPSKPLAFQLRKNEEPCPVVCSAGAGQLVIEADGTVLPCIGVKGMHQFRIGNIRTRTLAALFAESKEMNFPRLSRDLRECPAVFYQDRAELIQLTVERRRSQPWHRKVIQNAITSPGG